MRSKNGILIQYHNQLQSLDGKSVFTFLYKERIKTFYKNNGIKIDAILAKIKKLQEDAFEYENNEIKFIDDNPVLKEGQTMDDFNTKFTDLMNEDCIIK